MYRGSIRVRAGVECLGMIGGIGGIVRFLFPLTLRVYIYFQ